jgi:hypothetical protein
LFADLLRQIYCRSGCPFGTISDVNTARVVSEAGMLFTILIYGAEGLAERLPPAEQEALLQKHRDLQAKLRPRANIVARCN